jgi:FkbM family methyltransferase
MVYSSIPQPWMHRIRVRRFEQRQITDLEVYDRFADPARNALDIGANHGTVTRLLSRRFGRVHAFEPDPVNLAQLKVHAPENVSVHAIAISDNHGTAEMRTPIWGGAPSRGHGSLSKSFDGHDTATTLVPTAPLDSLKLSNLGLVKIDVEGFELAVLRGAKETLTAEKPPIWIEIEAIHGGEEHIQSVFDVLKSYGYEGSFHWKGNWTPLERFSVTVHQPEDGATRQAGEFVTDFLFESAAD